MAQEQRQMLTPETMGDGIVDFHNYQVFVADPRTIGIYRDQDVSLVQWNLEPGQGHPPHTHENFAQVLVVLQGSGEALRGENQPPIPIKAGQMMLAPRNVPHSIRNTGTERMSYITIATVVPQQQREETSPPATAQIQQ
jgi:quercetin dioxygenase-like cupin family protein